MISCSERVALAMRRSDEFKVESKVSFLVLILSSGHRWLEDIASIGEKEAGMDF